MAYQPRSHGHGATQYGTRDLIWSAISAYIQEKQASAHDVEAAQLARENIQDAFGGTPEQWKEKYSLEDIFTTGLAVLHGSHEGASSSSGDQSENAATAAAVGAGAGATSATISNSQQGNDEADESHSTHIDSNPLFHQFLEKLKATGYFQGAPEGSPEYREKYAKAADKFRAKMQGTTWGQSSNSQTIAGVEQADAKKEEGNNFLRAGNLDQAIQRYSDAINLCPSGPNSHTYYANRAAAYTKQHAYEKAVEDAKQATKIKPDWAKAYNRLGTALYYLGRYEEAVEAYETYLQYEPNDENVKSYLNNSREKASSQQQQGSGGQGPSQGGQAPSGIPGGLPAGMPDLNSMGGLEGLMNNPMVQQMTQQMMQNPEAMQNMMQSMFGGGQGGGGAPDMQNMMQSMLGGGAGGGAPGQTGGSQGPDMQNLMGMMQNMMGGAGGQGQQSAPGRTSEVATLLSQANTDELRNDSRFSDIVQAYEEEGEPGLEDFVNDDKFSELESELKNRRSGS